MFFHPKNICYTFPKIINFSTKKTLYLPEKKNFPQKEKMPYTYPKDFSHPSKITNFLPKEKVFYTYPEK